MKQSTDKSLVRSLASPALADSLVDIADAGLDAALDSGVLDGIPVIGLFTGAMKATREIRERLFLRKIALFLQQVSSTPIAERQQFVEQFESEEEQHRFGEAVILLLDRAEDMEKPKIIGRLIAALAAGNIEQRIALRLARMVDRSYSEDLYFLRSFIPGTQGKLVTVAESLFAVGFLSDCGFDGGNSAGEGSGTIYDINEYGNLLLKYGL